MTEYGLAGLRDKDGNRQVVEHTYEWDGDEITIKIDPPTISEQQQYEEIGEDADSERLSEIVDEHLVKPAIPDDEEWTTREMLCYIQGIVDFGSGGGGQLAADVRQELDERGGQSGN